MDRVVFTRVDGSKQERCIASRFRNKNDSYACRDLDLWFATASRKSQIQYMYFHILGNYKFCDLLRVFNPKGQNLQRVIANLLFVFVNCRHKWDMGMLQCMIREWYWMKGRGRDKLIGIGRNLAGKVLRDCNSIVCNSVELQFHSLQFCGIAILGSRKNCNSRYPKLP